MTEHPAAAPTAQPRRLARRYRLERVLGRGAMGTVWHAEDEVLRRAVAVKEVRLPPGLSDEERAVACERTLREARAIAALSHPNVVTLFDVIDEDSRPWVVMELVPAPSLSDVLAERGMLPPVEAARIGLSVLGALRAAHEVGITHRDVKPGNILVSADGRVKLTDFGIARNQGDSSLTSTGLLVGSPSYVSPEVARGREAGPPADMWSLGATLFAMVEGSPPFDSGDPVSTLTAVVGEPPRPMPHAGPLAQVITRMLEKDPVRRLSTDAARDLLTQVSSGALSAPPPPPPQAGPPRGPVTGQFQPGVQGPGGQGPGGPVGVRGPGSMPPGSSPARTGVTRPVSSGQPLPPVPGAPPGPPPSQRTSTFAPVPPGSRTGPFAHTAGPGSTGVGMPPRTGPPGPRKTGGQPRGLMVGLTIALVVALIAVGGYFLIDFAPSGGDGTDPTTTTEQTSEPTDDATTELPAEGYQAVADELGFTVEVPVGWEPTNRKENQVDYQSPDGRAYIRFLHDKPTSNSALKCFKDQKDEPNGPNSLPGYEELQLEKVDYGGIDAAVWEFTHTRDGPKRHVMWFAFVDQDNDIRWSMILTSLERDFLGLVDALNQAKNTFHS